MFNFDRADKLLHNELLEFAPNDIEGLLAAGDNFLAWADSDPLRYYDRYEDARYSFARVLEIQGWQPPVVERMMRYFIRTDNLGEVINLRRWFESNNRRRLSPVSLAELGGYLLDKHLETPRGVPNPYIESIESVRDMLLQAVAEDLNLPEPHYHLARYHHSLGNTRDERLTLENAIRAFDLARTENVRRRLNRVDAHFRYSNLLVNNREFFPAEEHLVKGIELYEGFLMRNLIRATPQLGQLYAARGDLEFYAKTGDRQAAANALRFYNLAEMYNHAPPEVLYRMGAAHYQLEDWGNSLSYLSRASVDMPQNRRILFALGNVSYQRGNYFAAQGYFNRLLDTLENQRGRLPLLLPNDNVQFLEIGERLMMARNNAGAVYEALAEQTGNNEFRSQAMSLYSESARAWDSITRNPETMTRPRLSEIPGAPGINLGFLNVNNLLRPANDYRPGIFPRIDRDGVEPSDWERLAPFAGN
jgi:tetratricopeptide (TPR) repeat protein